MKRFASILVVALVLAVGATVAQAGKGNKAANPDKAAKKDQKGVAGTVLKIDGTNITLQTRGKNGAEVTIATDADTKFESKGKPAAITDIKEGSIVVASPNTGTAKKIVIRPGKADKAKGAKPNKNADNA
jgi:hypothetical protein